MRTTSLTAKCKVLLRHLNIKISPPSVMSKLRRDRRQDTNTHNDDDIIYRSNMRIDIMLQKQCEAGAKAALLSSLLAKETLSS